MMQFPGDVKSAASASSAVRRAVYAEGAMSPAEVAALTGLFPAILFEPAKTTWPDYLTSDAEILIVEVDALAASQMERVTRFLDARPQGVSVLVAMRHANIAGTRALMQAGAADIVPLPATEAGWALAIERLLVRNVPREPAGKSGQIVALLKAGGGVGATSLGVQASHLISARGAAPSVCYADLDLQFGMGSLYFDLNDALTVTDCVAIGDLLSETQFGTALGAHKSGTRVLAAPHDVTPLDVLTSPLAEALMKGLRRDFALTIVDLPTAWTAWSNRVLQLADRIVMVTRLSVAHVHLVRRQLAVLAMQNLERVPLTLVCNGVTSDQQNMLSIKAAEKALGRPFDIVIPEDARTMGEAVNQGQPLSEVRRGSKLEKSISELADRIAADAAVASMLKR